MESGLFGLMVIVFAVLFGTIGFLAGTDITQRTAVGNSVAYYLCDEKTSRCEFTWGIK